MMMFNDPAYWYYFTGIVVVIAVIYFVLNIDKYIINKREAPDPPPPPPRPEFNTLNNHDDYMVVMGCESAREWIIPVKQYGGSRAGGTRSSIKFKKEFLPETNTVTPMPFRAQGYTSRPMASSGRPNPRPTTTPSPAAAFKLCSEYDKPITSQAEFIAALADERAARRNDSPGSYLRGIDYD